MIPIVQSHKKFIALLFLIFFGVLMVSSNIFAFETVWPNSPAGTSLDEDTTLSGLVVYLYEWMITIGGLAAFSVIVFAGIQYLTSTGDPGKIKEARDRITSAIGGLLLLLSTVLVLNIINPELITLSSPEFSTTSGMLTPMDFGEPSDLSASCEYVTIASSAEIFNPDADSTSYSTLTLDPGEKEEDFNESKGWKPFAFDIKGLCRVNLYTNDNCGEDVAAVLITDTPSINNIGLSDNDAASINCVAIESN